MTRRLFCLVLVIVASARAQDETPTRENPFKPFDKQAFAAAMKAAGATGEELTQFASACDAESPALAAEALVRARFPEYAHAAKLLEANDPRGVLALTDVLARAQDPYVIAHARQWLGRAFLDADDPDGAVEFFSDYLKQSRNRTPFDADVVFHYGSALARIPERQAAAGVLREFLTLFPDAPERYRASAAQLIAELEGKVNPLHEIADSMAGVERRIRKTDTGEETQRRQENVIAQLQKIIEQVEEMEKQGGGGGGGNPTSPRQQSNLTPGATEVGKLVKPKSVTDRWGMLKDRERKAIEGEAEAKLSGRYKKLVEDYYRKLSRSKSQ